MTNFRNNRELRKIDFELKAHQLDSDINTILKDLDECDNSKVIKKHFERVQYLVETYRELVWSGISLDISYCQEDMEALAGVLFDKYCELV